MNGKTNMHLKFFNLTIYKIIWEKRTVFKLIKTNGMDGTLNIAPKTSEPEAKVSLSKLI